MTPGVDGLTKQTGIDPRCGRDVDAFPLAVAVPLPHIMVGGYFRSPPWLRQKKDLK